MENKIVEVKKDKTQIEFYNPNLWKQMVVMAQSFVKSGALPKDDNVERVMMKIQAGYEMGMKPLEAVKSFYFVSGVMNIFGVAVTRRLTEHGWTISFKDEPNKCIGTITKGKTIYSDSLTFEEAEKSGWTKSSYGLKAGWFEGANRKQKLRYGVLSMLIKSYVPEVLGSAVDIAEIAEDTIPVIQGETVQTSELEGKEMDLINATKTKEELISICKKMKEEKSTDFHKAIYKQYSIKKAEFESELPVNTQK